MLQLNRIRSAALDQLREGEYLAPLEPFCAEGWEDPTAIGTPPSTAGRASSCTRPRPLDCQTARPLVAAMWASPAGVIDCQNGSRLVLFASVCGAAPSGPEGATGSRSCSRAMSYNRTGIHTEQLIQYLLSYEDPSSDCHFGSWLHEAIASCAIFKGRGRSNGFVLRHRRCAAAPARRPGSLCRVLLFDNS